MTASLAGAAMALTLAACAGSEAVRATESRSPARPTPIALDERGVLRAGAAEVDVTPPPGLPTRSTAGTTVGTLTRLHCRAFYLEYDAGRAAGPEAVALVSCDMGSPSMLLVRRVAERVRKLVPIGADRIVLSATGTRGAPRETPAKTPVGGADTLDALASFQAEAIAAGIERAHADAVAERDEVACVAWAETRPGSERPLHFGTNKSFGAFAENQLTREEETAFGPVPTEDRAVGGRIAVLRIDRCDDVGRSVKPLGAFAVVDVDPDAIALDADVYHGDVLGFASLEATKQVLDRRRCPEPQTASEGPPAPCFAVGIARGVSADVAPKIASRGPREARRLGVEVAREIVKLWSRAEAGLVRDAPLRVAYRELSLPGARAEASTPFFEALRRDVYVYPGDASRCGALVPFAPSGVLAKGCEARLCDTPEVGFAGSRAASSACSSPKVVTPLRFAQEPPHLVGIVPVQALYLADRIVVTVPGQETTLAGHRAEQQIERWLASRDRRDLGRVITLGGSNADVGPIATEAEYDAQGVEGAATLYGPSSARFFANQELCLVRWLIDPVDRKSDTECALDQPPLGWMHTLRVDREGHTEPFAVSSCAPRGSGSFVLASTADETHPIVSPRPHCGPDVRRVRLDAEEAFIARWIPPASCDAVVDAPRARIVDAFDSNREIASDERDSIEVRREGAVWRVIWRPDARSLSGLGGHPFRVELSVGSKTSKSPGHVERSEPFDPACR